MAKLGRCVHKACDCRVLEMQVGTLVHKTQHEHFLGSCCEQPSFAAWIQLLAHPFRGLGNEATVRSNQHGKAQLRSPKVVTAFVLSSYGTDQIRAGC